jgi:tetratricopeptide (TPR) repeat protein
MSTRREHWTRLVASRRRKKQPFTGVMMIPRLGKAPPSLWSIILAAALIGDYAVAPANAAAPDHPTFPPAKFPSGVPIRATKLPIKAGMPDPYAMLATAAAEIKSGFAQNSPFVQPDWPGMASSLMALAYLQLQSGDHAGAAQTLHDAEIAARSIWDGSWKCSMMAGVASMLAASGNVEDSRHLMHDAVAVACALTFDGTEEEIASERIRALIELGEGAAAAADKTTAGEVVNEALEMVKRLGNDSKAAFVGSLVNVQLRLKRFKEARATAQLISRKESDETLDSLLETIAKAQAVAGNVADALDTLQLIDANSSYGDETLLEIAKCCAAAGNVTQAIALLPRFNDYAMNLSRDEALFRIAAAQAAAGDFAAAVVTTNRMHVYGGYPFESLIAIAKARFARHDVAGAQATLRDAAELALATAREYGPAAVWLYDSVEKLVAALLAMQDKPEAQKTLRDVATGALEHKDPRSNDAAHTLTRIAKAQIAVGDIQGARHTVQAALVRAATFEEVHPSDQKSAALAAIAQLQSQLRDEIGMRKTFQAAADAARQLNKEGHLIRALGIIAVARSQAAVGEKASAFALTNEENFSRASGWMILAALAEVRAIAGDDEGAESLLLDLPLGDFVFPYQHHADRRGDVIAMLIRHGRYSVVGDIAERAGSAYLYAVIAEEVFRMNGFDIDPPLHWSRKKSRSGLSN